MGLACPLRVWLKPGLLGNLVHLRDHSGPITISLIVKAQQMQATVDCKITHFFVNCNATGQGPAFSKFNRDRDIAQRRPGPLRTRKRQNVRGFVDSTVLLIELPEH